MAGTAGAAWALTLGSAAGSAPATRAAEDWPGWLGPNRDAHSPSTRLLREWPAGGPKLLWRVNNLGPGWSSFAVVDNRLYTTGNSLDKQMLICLDVQGRDQWRVAQGPACSHNKYPGARSTPTVDGDRLYVTGGNGLVTCHSIADGRILWQRDMKTELGGKAGGWLYAESVLILDNTAIVTPGGKNAVVALDKHSGQEIWKSDVSITAGYSSCIAIRGKSGTIIANGSQSGLFAVDAQTGKQAWKNDFAANNTANVPTPAYADGILVWSVGYGKGSIGLHVGESGGQWTFKEAWTTKDMGCHPGNFLIEKGAIYGSGQGRLVCLDLATGQTRWSERQRFGANAICWADGLLFAFAQSKGVLSLVEPSAGGTKVLGQFSVEGEGQSWALPVVIGGKLYVRYDANLYCYDVGAA